MNIFDPKLEPVRTSPQSLSRWQGRDVQGFRGTWAEVRERIPTFEKQDFTAPGHLEANPYLCAIVRLPLNEEDEPLPVATVGPRYGLVQHWRLGDLCCEVLDGMGLHFEWLPCVVRMSELGEWAHLRFQLSDDMGVT